MTTRRDCLIGMGAFSLGTITPARALFANESTQPSSVANARDFGAVGDGKTEATDALLKAFSSGQVIDGKGGVFAVRGSLRAGPKFKGIVNAHLIQLEPDGDGRRTLQIESAEDFILENLSVDRRGTGGEHPDIKLMDDTGGIFIIKCRNFRLSDVRVTGGGIGTGLAIIASQAFSVKDSRVHDLFYRLPEHPTDDAIQGFAFLRSSDFQLEHNTATDIGGSDGRTISHDNNRGFAFGGSREFTVNECKSINVGQGFDITGKSNNHFTVTSSTAENCTTWGFKCARQAQAGTFDRCRATLCGIAGFVAAAPAETGTTSDLTYKDCTAEEVRGNYKSGSSFGFGIMTNREKHSGFPRGITYENCAAINKNPGNRMLFGFRNDVPSDLTEGHPNQVSNCRAEGYVKAAFEGFS